MRLRTRKKSLLASPLLWVVIGIVCAVGAWQLSDVTLQEVKILPLNSFAVEELKPLQFTAGSKLTNLMAEECVFSLVQPPKGATIEPATGKFSWTPGEADGPKAHTIVIRLQARANPSVADQQSVQVNVKEANLPPVMASIPPQRVAPGQLLSFKVDAHDPDEPANTLRYSLGPDRPPGTKIDSVKGVIQWTAPSDAAIGSSYPMTVNVTDAERGGASHSQVARVTIIDSPQPPTSPTALAPPKFPTTPPSSTPSPNQTSSTPSVSSGARMEEAPPPLTPGGTGRIAELFVTPKSGTIQRETGSLIRDSEAAPEPDSNAGSAGLAKDFVDAANESGLSAHIGPRLKIPGMRGKPSRVVFDKELVRVLEYPSVEDAAADAARITSDGTLLDDKPAPWKSLMAVYKHDRLLILYAGTNDSLLKFLADYTAKPVTASPGSLPKNPTAPATGDEKDN